MSIDLSSTNGMVEICQGHRGEQAGRQAGGQEAMVLADAGTRQVSRSGLIEKRWKLRGQSHED
jgi:hypothetical protein